VKGRWIVNEVIEFEYENDDGEECVGELPARYEVCSRCGGRGKHVNPSIDGNGITSSEWAEWDEDDRDTYLSGGYDVTCEKCDGRNVVLEVDEAAIRTGSAEVKAVFKAYRAVQRSLAESLAIQAAERRYGA
jgi:RecJ-like exonuclease